MINLNDNDETIKKTEKKLCAIKDNINLNTPLNPYYELISTSVYFLSFKAGEYP